MGKPLSTGQRGAADTASLFSQASALLTSSIRLKGLQMSSIIRKGKKSSTIKWCPISLLQMDKRRLDLSPYSKHSS